MTTPQVVRPTFPQGYVDNPKRFLTWEEVEQKLAKALHYWICSVRPNGRPHAIPKWGAWFDGILYFDGSPETRHARNIAQNPFISLHLESGEQAVIVEGTVKEIRPPHELAINLAGVYRAKYAPLGYSPEPAIWDEGGLFAITLDTVIAWNSFAEDPTKFIFTDH